MSFVRRNYFVLKGLQLQIILLVTLILFLVVAVTVFNMTFFGLYFLEHVSLEDYHRLVSNFKLGYALIKDKLLGLAIVNLVILFVVGIFFSHQIAGPIYKLESFLKKIGEGDLSLRIKFRSTDKVGQLAEYINKMADGLEEKLSRMKLYAEKIRNSGGELSRNPDFEELARLLDSFKTTRKDEESPE